MPFSSRPGTFKSRGCFGAPSQHDGIKLALQVLHGNVVPDVRIGHKLHALGRHLLQPAVDDALFHLELRNAIPQQPADAVGLLIHRDPMPGAI